MQLSLAIRLPPPDPMALLRSQGFYCDRYRCTMTRASCVARQGSKRLEHCATGDCMVGLRNLMHAGLIMRERCVCCGGSGWVPRRS